jgi:hypothetical protein
MILKMRQSLQTDPVVSPLLLRAILVIIGAMLVNQTAKFFGLIGPAEPKVLVDFDAFHIVGRMVWRGEIEEAYHFVTMSRAQRLLGGADSFLPWTYPPQFDLLVAPLALVPIGLAYFAFTAATLAAYLLVLRRIAGEAFGAVLLVTFPTFIVTIACGQNGFLTGALIGLSCMWLLQQRPIAGFPLGLMIIKPHLTAAFVLFTLATRRWGTIALAAAVVALTSAIATLAFGPGIWSAFLNGAAEARSFLKAGVYPLFRMISSYAFMRSLGFSASVAMAAHGAVAMCALAMVWTAIRQGMSQRQVLGLAALASLLVSPYAYDYDMPIFGIALALLMPDLQRLLTSREQAVLFGLSSFACMWGIAQTTIRNVRFGANNTPDGVAILSLAGAALVPVLVLVWRALRRDARPSRADAARPSPASAAA